MTWAGFFLGATMVDNHTPETQKQGRRVALVIAASALLSILAPELRETLRLDPKYEILFYLFAMAGFLWALIVTWKLWQKTRDK